MTVETLARRIDAPRWRARLRSYADRLGPAYAVVAGRVRPVTTVVAPLGWTVLGSSLAAWILGWQLGWIELTLIAVTGLFVLALCALLTLGRTNLRVTVEVRPRRMVVGTPAAGRITITNLARTRLLPVALELSIGRSAARFNLPSLGGGDAHEELFVVPTSRRGVIPVGPATTVRGDPFGLLRRAVPWTDVTELFVHPVTVGLDPFGSGFLRDLEGRTTNDTSMSDLAFHTLRDYAPGDDRRYIHWRSSAKASAGSTSGRFLVRQFLDTRRSHLMVIVDGDLDDYPDPADFETAISVGASVAVRAIRDETDTTVVAAGRVVRAESVQRTLDGFARTEPGPVSLADAAARGVRYAPETSVALVVTGAVPTFPRLFAATAPFAPEVTTVALRVDPTVAAGMSTTGPMTVLTLSRLADLPALLRAVGLR